MIFPKFLERNDIVVVVGISGKIDNNKMVTIEKANKHFRSNNIQVKLTKSVNIYDEFDLELKATDFNNLIKDKKIKVINNSAGGEVALGTIEYINFEIWKNNPKMDSRFL